MSNTYKRIYLVRHGEVEANKRHAVPYEGEGLSGDGVKQAEIVAKRMESIPVDIVIASTCERAKQTADIINKKIDKEIVYSNLFDERRYPKETIGKELAEPETARIIALMWKNDAKNPSAHISDEENFLDFKGRVVEAMKYLKNLKKEKVLVVSHRAFLKTFLAMVLLGEELDFKDFKKIGSTTTLDNTSISVLDYNTASAGGTETPNESFKIRVLNDHAHLGEY